MATDLLDALPAASTTVTVMVLVPAFNAMPGADQRAWVVVPSIVATPSPPRLFDHFTCDSRRLSVAVPPRSARPVLLLVGAASMTTTGATESMALQRRRSASSSGSFDAVESTSAPPQPTRASTATASLIANSASFVLRFIPGIPSIQSIDAAQLGAAKRAVQAVCRGARAYRSNESMGWIDADGAGIGAPEGEA
jgi:hypothetical protein